MKYLLLAYGDDKWGEAMSIRERDAFEAACLANELDLRHSGHLFAVEGLQCSSTAIIVRVMNGKTSLSDGPCVESNEQLNQLFLINARDLNEAIQVASKMPQVRRGPIEVRPIAELD